jgi:hypothetical protein
VNAAIFQITVALGGLGFLVIFMNEMDAEKATRLQRKSVGALFLYTFSMFTLLLPATTRQTYQLGGLVIPPIYVWLEAVLLGFLISITWEVFFN